jgi:hypothetical protein
MVRLTDQTPDDAALGHQGTAAFGGSQSSHSPGIQPYESTEGVSQVTSSFALQPVVYRTELPLAEDRLFGQ